MVTCTDMATLCGNTPEACLNKYGSTPLKHKSCHEAALRILIRAIDSHAVRHGRYVRPLLCVSVDFYIRCFVELYTSPVEAKNSASKLSYVRACATCHSFEFQPLIRKTVRGTNPHFGNALYQSNMIATGISDGTVSNRCTHCGQVAIHIAGPIYNAPIQDVEFIAALLKRLKETPVEERLDTHERILGMLTVVSEELHDVPLYFEYDQLMSVVKCPVPKFLTMRSAICNAGYRCSIAHSNPKALKTDAPISFIWDICREWARKNSIDPEKLRDDSAGRTILMSTTSREVNFAHNKLAVQKSKSECLLRFQDNKGKNWGPKMRAKKTASDGEAS